MKVHHVGYLIKNLENAIQEFQKLGYKIEKNVDFTAAVDPSHLINIDNADKSFLQSNIIHDDIRDVDIVFMANEMLRIELVQPSGKDSSVYGLLKRYSNCPYHICYYSDDILRDIELLREMGGVDVIPTA